MLVNFFRYLASRFRVLNGTVTLGKCVYCCYCCAVKHASLVLTMTVVLYVAFSLPTVAVLVVQFNCGVCALLCVCL